MSQPPASVLRDAYPEVFFFIDRGECALGYSAQFREFSLEVRPGRPVLQRLAFCPFSGRAFPEPLRNRFFDELASLGLDDGLADMERAPTEYQSETWWIRRGL